MLANKTWFENVNLSVKVIRNLPSQSKVNTKGWERGFPLFRQLRVRFKGDDLSQANPWHPGLLHSCILRFALRTGGWTNSSEWTPAKVGGHLFRVSVCPAQQGCPGDYRHPGAQLQRKRKQKCVWPWVLGVWKTQIQVVCQQHQQTFLPVCVFGVSFKSVWAGWNILWACSLGWQVGVTSQS